MNTSTAPGSCGARASALPTGFRPALSVAVLLLAVTLSANAQKDQPLAAKIQRLVDEEEIRNVLVSYGRTLDAHDFGAYSRLFAKDGEWVGGFGSVKGPAAIEAFMAKNIGGPGKPGGTYHLLTNFLIDVHGDTATAWSRWTFVIPGPDKKPAMAQGGHYEDTLIRENGQWKFSRREAFVDIPHADTAPAK
jgi:uncharacterized protein (TIGR02246 family)